MFWKNLSFCFKIVGKIAEKEKEKKNHQAEGISKRTTYFSHFPNFFQGHLYLEYFSL